MKTRKSARVVLINDRDEVFMFLSGDLTRSHGVEGQACRYWVLPGGGLERGESWEQAALREMWEETGIDHVPLGPLIWTRKGVNTAGGAPWGSEERYFLVRYGGRQISNANQLPHEREHYTISRWWSLADMRASSDVFFPEPLADLLAPVIAGEQIIPPIDLAE